MRKLVPRKDRFLNHSNESDSDEESVICLGELSLPDDVVVSTKEKVRQSEPVSQESSGVALLFKSLPLEVCDSHRLIYSFHLGILFHLASQSCSIPIRKAPYLEHGIILLAFRIITHYRKHQIILPFPDSHEMEENY